MDDLKAKLAAQEIELTQKNEDANKLIQIVGAETEKVSKEKAIADEEEQKVTIIPARRYIKLSHLVLKGDVQSPHCFSSL